MRPKRRKPLVIEAQVRALKLWLINGEEPKDIVEDIEKTFGIDLAPTNHERPRRFLRRLQDKIQRKLFDHRLDKRERQHLNKLLEQAELISYLREDDE